jgi:hypothetical protein
MRYTLSKKDFRASEQSPKNKNTKNHIRIADKYTSDAGK